MGLRKLSPGGHEYLINSVACSDRPGEFEDSGEFLSQYFLSRGYPAGVWIGAGARNFGLAGEVTAAQLQALFGEGRHPHANAIEAEALADGASSAQALAATRLGTRFPQYSDVDGLDRKVRLAYRDHNLEHGDRPGTPIDKPTRERIRKQVLEGAYREAHGGTQPGDEKELNTWLAAQRSQRKQAVAGYEMVFEPDKSVSIAWALAGPAQREGIAELVRQATRDALEYAETNAIFTRAGAGGVAQVDTRGMTAATFEHWDSRAGDPHLHVHALVSTKVQRVEDGKWLSIDGRTLMAATVTISEFFNSRLRDLFRERGAVWTPVWLGGDTERPVWRLAAVPPVLVRAFSRRHAQFEATRAARIVEFRAKHGREPRPKEIFAIDRQAQYDNRPGKQPAKTLAEHVAVWRAYATATVGPDAVAAITPAVLSGADLVASPVEVAGLAAATLAAVADKRAHFTRWNLEAEAHRQTAHLTVPAAERQQLITTVVETVITRSDTMAITAPAPAAEPLSLRRASGESVFTVHNHTRYTTQQLLAAEDDLVAWARQTGGHRLRVETVHAALRGAGLNTGQQAMVTAFARSGRRVQLALAPAGTGKTTAMRVLADAWRRTGTTVWAFAPSARAAAELGQSIGARPNTLHALNLAIAFGNPYRFNIGRGDLVIVDEAAMAGTHTLHTALRYALQRGAEVRLVGDDAQLAAVEAGGAVRLIAHDVGAVHLDAVMRFRGPDRADQAHASLLLRNADPAGLAFYLERGRVEHGSVETMRAAAHAAWRADLEAGRQSLLIVSTHEDTTALNAEGRALRLQRGEVDGRTGLKYAVTLRDDTTASAGDWVVTRFNSRLDHLFGGRDFVKNGDTWTVQRVHRDGALTVAHRVHGGVVTLEARYVAAHVELAYAGTVNTAQGMTSTGNAHLLVHPTMTREQFYPGATRAMYGNYLYVVTDHHVIDEHQETPDPQTPEQVLATVLARSSAEPSATEQIRTTLAAGASLATLGKMWDFAARYRDTGRYHTLLQLYAPATLNHASTPALIQQLRNAHDRGHSPDTILATLTRTTRHSARLADADDPAALLTARITTYLNRTPTTNRPSRASTPAQVHRWRSILTDAIPHLHPTGTPWESVWALAAAALTDGHNPDTLLADAARAIMDSPHPPRHDWLAVHDQLTRYLTAYLASAPGMPLPWLARPDRAYLSVYPGHTEYLDSVATAITNRVDTLRTAAIRDQPAWTTALSPRPDNPVDADEWDTVAGLVAAYRDTFQITSGPTAPLGELPDGHGPRTQAWAELTRRIRTLAGEPTAIHLPAKLPTYDTSIDLAREQWLDYHDDHTDHHTLELLDVLVRRHELLARDGDADHYLDLLAQHCPTAINQPAEQTLLNALADAQDTGWQAHHLIPLLTRHTHLHTTDDPAAALAARVRSHTRTHTPPPRTADPAADDIQRWRRHLQGTNPQLDTSGAAWHRVWETTAAAAVDGLDSDALMRAAGREIAAKPNSSPIHDHTTAINLIAHHRTHHPAHYHPAGADRPLPWQARPDCRHWGLDPAQPDDLAAVDDLIAARTAQLRSTVIHNPPPWAAALGIRPATPDDTAHWDELAGLIAAYRETFHIHTGPEQPLGPPPRNPHTARAHAWRHLSTTLADLTGLTNPSAATADPSHHTNTHTERTAVRENSAGEPSGEVLDCELWWDYIDESTDDRYLPETLDVLVRRYELLARDGDERRYLKLLERYCPAAINQPAEAALLNALADAQDAGWQAHRLLPLVVRDRTHEQDNLYTDADDPAALLTAHLRAHIHTHTAPARTAQPHADDIVRWQAILTTHLPEIDVTEPAWTAVWTHAAAGLSEGLDPDRAIEHAATSLVLTGPSESDPRPATTSRVAVADASSTPDGPAGGPAATIPHAVQTVGKAVVTHLASQKHANGEHLPLPWQARHDITAPHAAGGQLERLATLNAEITARIELLADHAIREEPVWMTRLGPRPAHPDNARLWDTTVRLTAAYRESHNVATGPDQPLGHQPHRGTGRATVYATLANHWDQLRALRAALAAHHAAVAHGRPTQDGATHTSSAHTENRLHTEPSSAGHHQTPAATGYGTSHAPTSSHAFDSVQGHRADNETSHQQLDDPINVDRLGTDGQTATHDQPRLGH